MVDGDWTNIDEADWAKFLELSCGCGIGVAGKRESTNEGGSVR